MAMPHPRLRTTRPKRFGNIPQTFFAAIFLLAFMEQSNRLLSSVSVGDCIVAETVRQDRTLSNLTELLVPPVTRAQALSEKPPAPISNVAWPGNLDHLADKNNVIVVVTVTCPYIHMLDNLIESMRRVNVTNVAMVPLDEGAPRVLKAMYGSDDEYKFGHVLDPPPFVDAHESFSSKPAGYKDESFGKIVSWRPKVIKAFLEQNYTVFYTDTDTYWRSNPLEFLHRSATTRYVKPSGQGDAVDAHVTRAGTALETFNFDVPESAKDTVSGEAFDMIAMFDTGKTNVCTGYLYMQPTPQSIVAMAEWIKNLLASRVPLNQPAFEAMYKSTTKRSQKLHRFLTERGPRFKKKVADDLKLNKDRNFRSRVYLDNNIVFPSGGAYAKKISEEQKENVLMIHGNFIVGMGNKAAALEKWGVWKPSGRLPQFSSQCTAGSG